MMLGWLEMLHYGHYMLRSQVTGEGACQVYSLAVWLLASVLVLFHWNISNVHVYRIILNIAVFYYLRAYEISVFELVFFVVPDNMIDTRMITLFVILLYKDIY